MNVILSLLVLWLGITNVFADTTDLNTVVVESSRSNSVVTDINKNISIITAEDIANSTAQNLPQLLGSQAGIYSIYDGNIKNSLVGMHGGSETSASNVLVLVDGRRTNQIDLSGVDWAQINLNAIDHIEIIKGAGTVLYGDNANTGIINIITKKGKKGTKPKLAVSSQWGSYQANKETFNLSGGLPTLGYQFDYTHDQTSAYRANSDYWGNDFNTRLNYDPTDVFGIDFSQGYHRDHYQSPGALFLSDIGQLGRKGVKSSHKDDRAWTSDSYFTVTPRLKFDAGNSDGEFSLLSTARKRFNKSYSTGTPEYETMYLTDSYEFQPKVVVHTTLTDRLGNKVTTGYDEFYAKSHRRSGNLGSDQDLTYVSKATHEVYLLDEVILDEKWIANVGARGAWAEYVFDQKAQVVSKTKRSSTTQGYEGGLGYKYNPKSKVYMNFSRSYRLPNTDEFYQNIYTAFGGGGGLNTDLTYQTGNQFSWGVQDQTIKDTKLGLNFFIDRYKNEIYLDYVNFNLVNTNYEARTRHYGVEAEASVDLLEGKLSPYINATFQDANFLKGKYAHQKLPLVPNQMANAGITVRPVSGLSTSFSVQEVGKRFAITDMTNEHAKLKRYTTTNWGIKYGFKHVEVWFNIDNLFNSKYYAFGTYSPFSNDIGYYPAPGRNYTAGMKLEF